MKKGLRKVLCVERLLGAVLCIGMLCSVVVGCIPENIHLPGYGSGSSDDTAVVVPSLEVSFPNNSANYFTHGISFEHTASELSVVFRVAEDWMVKVVDEGGNPVSWCQLSASLGGAGLHEMKIWVEENTGSSLRSARIVFMAFEETSRVAEIVVEQEGVTIFLEHKDYEVAPHDTTLAVELKANVDFEYKILDADWVHEQPAASRALTSHSVAFAIDANPSHKSREAHILFYSYQYPVAADTLTIVQQGLTPTVTFPDGYTDYFAEDLIFSHVKGEAEVAFHSNVDWTLQLVAASGDSTTWCSVGQSSGKVGLQKVKVRVTDNNAYTHRSLTLRLMCDTTVMAEIQVLQERENAILLGRKTYAVSCEATTIDVSLSTNVDFEYKIQDADWVREQQSKTRSLTTHNLTFEVDANPLYEPRETKIVFYSTQYAIADTLTLVQGGLMPVASIPEGYPDYFTNGLSFSPTAGEAEVTFLVDVDWQLTIGSSSSWLSVDPVSGSAGRQTVTVRVTENNTKVDRTATISLMYGAIEIERIRVTQERLIPEASIVEGEDLYFDYTAEEKEFTFRINTNWSIETTNYSSWLSVDPASGSAGTHKVKVRVKENKENNSRSGSLGIMSDTGELLTTLWIEQEYNSDAVAYAVDLGLSVMWATYNVSANSPEDYGGRYAWGETEVKDDYNIENYKYRSDENGDGHFDWNECLDIGDNIGGTKYDVAHVKWGNGWRMPTADEMRELRDECSWIPDRRNGVDGYTIRGNNGNSIFLPIENHTDCYWSETIEPASYFMPQCFYIQKTDEIYIVCDWHGGKWEGFFVRPVTEY